VAAGAEVEGKVGLPDQPVPAALIWPVWWSTPAEPHPAQRDRWPAGQHCPRFTFFTKGGRVRRQGERLQMRAWGCTPDAFRPRRVCPQSKRRGKCRSNVSESRRGGVDSEPVSSRRRPRSERFAGAMSRRGSTGVDRCRSRVRGRIGLIRSCNYSCKKVARGARDAMMVSRRPTRSASFAGST
jgi:hypothetical protein